MMICCYGLSFDAPAHTTHTDPDASVPRPPRALPPPIPDAAATPRPRVADDVLDGGLDAPP